MMAAEVTATGPTRQISRSGMWTRGAATYFILASEIVYVDMLRGARAEAEANTKKP